MKKIISIILALIFICALSACGNNAENSPDPSATETNSPSPSESPMPSAGGGAGSQSDPRKPVSATKWGPLLTGLYTESLAGDYHIKFRVDVRVDGASADGEGWTAIYRDLGMSMTEINTLGVKTSIFTTDAGYYSFDTDSETLKPIEADNFEDSAAFANMKDAGFTLVNWDNEAFNGKTMAYEDYTTDISDDILRYYFDGATWAEVRFLNDEGIDMTYTVLEITTVIPEWIRNIPNYTVASGESVRFKDKLYQYWSEEKQPEVLPDWQNAEDNGDMQIADGYTEFDVWATEESYKIYLALLAKNGYTLGKDSDGLQTAENNDVRIVFVHESAPYIVYISSKSGGKWATGMLPCVEPPKGKPLICENYDCAIDEANFSYEFIAVGMNKKEVSDYLITIPNKGKKSDFDIEKIDETSSVLSCTVTLDGKTYDLMVDASSIGGGNYRFTVNWTLYE